MRTLWRAVRIDGIKIRNWSGVSGLPKIEKNGGRFGAKTYFIPNLGGRINSGHPSQKLIDASAALRDSVETLLRKR